MVTAENFLAARNRISGNGAGNSTSGIPCKSRGRTKFENPYECAIEMHARLGAAGVSRMVETMLTASAASCGPVNAMHLAAPVLAEVSFKCAISPGGIDIVVADCE